MLHCSCSYSIGLGLLHNSGHKVVSFTSGKSRGNSSGAGAGHSQRAIITGSQQGARGHSTAATGFDNSTTARHSHFYRLAHVGAAHQNAGQHTGAARGRARYLRVPPRYRERPRLQALLSRSPYLAQKPLAHARAVSVSVCCFNRQRLRHAKDPSEAETWEGRMIKIDDVDYLRPVWAARVGVS